MAKQSFLDFMNVKYVFLNEDEEKEKVSAEHGGKRIINSKLIRNIKNLLQLKKSLAQKEFFKCCNKKPK